MTQVGMIVHGGSTAVPETQRETALLCGNACIQCILAVVTERQAVPGSYSLSRQNERLFLFGQTVEGLQTRVKPAGSPPFLPRHTATRRIDSLG